MPYFFTGVNSFKHLVIACLMSSASVEPWPSAVQEQTNELVFAEIN